MFNAEGDEPIPNATSLLPNLEALSMKNWGQTTLDDYSEFLTTNPPRKITYFKPEKTPYKRYCLIPQYLPSLRCLELSLDIEEIRDEDDQYSMAKALLALIPDLYELAFHFSSGWTYIYQEDGTSQNPLPMDEEILSNIIKALPKSSNLQVLRMKDDDDGEASSLAVQSSTFASLREYIPSTLKVLQWETEKSIVRYEFEPGQPVRIVDSSEQRQWPDTLLWTDASILKHLRS